MFLSVTSKEGLVVNVKLKLSLGWGDHEMMEFDILRAMRRAYRELITLDSRRADFDLFKGLPGRVPWDSVLEERGSTQESWMIFKDFLLQAQKQCIPMKKKSGKKSRKLTWMNKELLDKQEGKVGTFPERRDRYPGTNTEK